MATHDGGGKNPKISKFFADKKAASFKTESEKDQWKRVTTHKGRKHWYNEKVGGGAPAEPKQ